MIQVEFTTKAEGGGRAQMKNFDLDLYLYCLERRRCTLQLEELRNIPRCHFIQDSELFSCSNNVGNESTIARSSIFSHRLATNHMFSRSNILQFHPVRFNRLQKCLELMPRRKKDPYSMSRVWQHSKFVVLRC